MLHGQSKNTLKPPWTMPGGPHDDGKLTVPDARSPSTRIW
jgi:hypothetical protein